MQSFKTPLIILLLIFPFALQGQNENQVVADLAKEKLKTFQNILEKLTSNNLTDPEKRRLIFIALKLFSPEATIQTMDLKKNRKAFPVREYLERVTFPLDSRVDTNIKFQKEPEITKIERVNYNKELKTSDEYLVHGRLVQYFEKLVNGEKKYSDYTIKTAKVRVSLTYDFIKEEESTDVLIVEISAEEIY